MTTFHFNWYKKAGEAILFALVFSLLTYLIDWEVPNGSTFFLGLLAGAFLFFLVIHGLRPLESYHFQKEGLMVHRPLRGDLFFPFRQVRRIVIREEKNSLGPHRLTLKLFRKDGQNRLVVVSDLKHKSAFLREIESKAQDFKIIYQNEQGEVTRTV